MDAFETALREQTHAEVYFDRIHCQAYSVDASIYEVKPLGVVIPKDKKDILSIIRLADEYRVPLIARGAATGITGGCLGEGLIVDTSKYFNLIREINYEQEYAVVEPGVVQDQLNAALASKGYRLGPDTSTGNRATIGGMLANNAAGSHSLLYGKMVDHILEVEMALADGNLIVFKCIDKADFELKRTLNNTEGKIYREIFRIKEFYDEDIRRHFPDIPRRASGYNLDELIKPQPLNLAKLIAGSEGSLGIITEMKVQISKRFKTAGVCVVHFNSMIEGMRTIEQMLTFKPVALEMIDDKIIEMGRLSPTIKGKLGWLKAKPRMVFVAEFDHADSLNAFTSEMDQKQIGYARVTITDPTQIAAVWEVRKAGLGLLLSKRSYSRAIAFIEDGSVAPGHLAAFIDEFQKYLIEIGKDAGMYGHVGPGCMHVRPYIDLRKVEEVALMKKIMCDVSTMILKHGGAMSGEHGDGRLRTWLNRKMFGERIYQAFIDIKSVFDPRNLMNPGKIVHGTDFLDQLRLSPETQIASIPTFMSFEREGGLALAVDLCNGNGACRKTEGVMCPSFQATGNEYDTTRARAQSLRAIINGRFPLEDLTSPDIHDVLDLCLQCKGCKTECPSQVDMAKMKAEVLYHYQQKHGYSLRTRLFAHIGRFNALASHFPKLYNYISSWNFTKKLLTKIGITPNRELPQLAEIRFSKWFHQQPEIPTGQSVVLFSDTYTEFNFPEIGQAAVKILQALGYQVIVPSWSCCGRPMISKGMLQEAKKAAQRLVDQLYPYAEEGLPIIGLEPSCILTLRDEFRDLVDDQEKVMMIAKSSVTLDEFLDSQIVDNQLPLAFTDTKSSVKVHGHCHQKSLVGMKPTLNVLRSVPGFSVEEIASGCCGVAGSFGYEAEHYEISMKIGELKLLPAIRKATSETIFVADGVSCRSQIAHGTTRTAKHLAEVIAEKMKK